MSEFNPMEAARRDAAETATAPAEALPPSSPSGPDGAALARLSDAIVAHGRWLETAGAAGARLRMADHLVLGRRKPVIARATLDEADLAGADVSGWKFEP